MISAHVHVEPALATRRWRYPAASTDAFALS